MPKKENRHSLTLEFSNEKMDALLFHLEENGSGLEVELEQYLEKLYEKTVPTAIKKYLSAKQKRTAGGGSESGPPKGDAG